MKKIISSLAMAASVSMLLTGCVPGSFTLSFGNGSATGSSDDPGSGDVMLLAVLGVSEYTNDSTPTVLVTASEAGTFVYGGDCTSSNTVAVAGTNAITFDALADGAHGNCTIELTNAISASSGELLIPEFTVDTSVPTLAEVRDITSTSDTTPYYVFSSNEAGTIIYSGDCSSATTDATSGENNVEFDTLSTGTYTNCSLEVVDAAGNHSSALDISDFNVIAARGVNDTGISLCGDYAFLPGSTVHNNDLDCLYSGSVDEDGDPVPLGQDAFYGRDGNVDTNSDDDGVKGFSFTKLAADGSELAIQTGSWNENGSEVAGTRWSCVRDNVTGLIWQTKTNDNTLHDKDWRYTWYNSTGVNDAGEYGIGDTGTASTTGYETTVGAINGSDNCSTAARCDTEKYVEDVNNTSLCGVSNWRVPSSEELMSIVVKGVSPSVSVEYFPNTIAGAVWTSNSNANASKIKKAWRVNFTNGEENYSDKATLTAVRLVSTGSGY